MPSICLSGIIKGLVKDVLVSEGLVYSNTEQERIGKDNLCNVRKQ